MIFPSTKSASVVSGAILVFTVKPIETANYKQMGRKTQDTHSTYVEVLLVLESVVDLGNSVVGLISDELILAIEVVQLTSDTVSTALDAWPLAQARVQARVHFL